MKLVTDRTFQDLKRAREMKAKIISNGWNSLTATEQAEWLAPMKGRYETTDLNRVESAVAYLKGQFESLGYRVDTPTIKTDWTQENLVTESDAKRYLKNIQTMRELITQLPTTPETPKSMALLNWAKANDIEKILVDLEDALTRLKRSWFYSDEIGCGEV